MKSSIKKTLIACVVSSALIASSAFAATTTLQPNPNQITGIKYLSKSAASIGGYNYCQFHASDVCINNNTYGGVSFSIPLFAQAGPIPSNVGADVWSNYQYPSNYPSIPVLIWNMYGTLIFNQPVYNYSIININSSATGAAGGKLTVTVTH